MRLTVTNVTRTVVGVSVCVLVTLTYCAKTAETIDMPFGKGLTHMGPRNRGLDGSRDRTNAFVAATGDKSAMWPFAKLLWALVIFSCMLCVF